MNGTIDNIQFPFFLASLMLLLRAQCEQNLRNEQDVITLNQINI